MAGSSIVGSPPEGVAYCRGVKCDQVGACEHEQRCLYRSSAEVFRESAGVPHKALPETEFAPLVAGSTYTPVVRTFESGATRDLDTSKLDYEGFLSPLVLKRYAEFMHKNRVQRDGTLRSSDNWQKGIPKDVYMKSLFRHFFDSWDGHRSGDIQVEELCGVLFNAMGYMHELLKPDPR